MDEKLRYQLDEFKGMRNQAFVSAYELDIAGRYIAGVYGVNVPREIFWAMDIVPVDVFGIDGSNTKEAEKYMDEKECTLLKAGFGYVVTDRCPFSHFARIMVGTSSCPDRESMIHRLGDIKDTYIINEYKDVSSIEKEYRQLIGFLERNFGVEFDEKKLASIVEKTNEEAGLIQEIIHIYMSNPFIMGCDDLNSVIYGSRFIFDLDMRLERLKQLTDTLKKSFIPEHESLDVKRILIAGAPMEGMVEEILKPLSEIKCGIISLSCCEGGNYRIVSGGNNLLHILAQKYVCEDFSDQLKYTLQLYDIDAVISLKFKGCYFKDRGKGVPKLPFFEAEIDYCAGCHEVLKEVKSFIEGL